MSITRVEIAFALTCWACLGDGRRTSASIERVQSVQVESGKPVKSDDTFYRFTGRVSGKGVADPLIALARLCAFLNATATFSHSGREAHAHSQRRFGCQSRGHRFTPSVTQSDKLTASSQVQSRSLEERHSLLRRAQFLRSTAAIFAAVHIWPSAIYADEPRISYMPGIAGTGVGKNEMDYSDFTRTRAGLLYRDVTVGTGKSPEKNDRAVIEWSGYTIGYRGVPFETKKLKKLDKIEEEFFRFVVGEGKVIPAIDEGVQGMQEGGIRRLVVPYDLSYPASDPNHDKVGPKPSTFSGQQALNFVLLDKGMIDKTLLINVKLVRVDKSNGRGGFITKKE